MTVGIRTGVRCGVRCGVATGIGADTVGPDIIPGVTRDSISGKYVPANAAEWGIVLAVAGVTSGNPSALYSFQEASGNLADSIGTFTLVVAGTAPTYQVSVPGWSRKSLLTVDNSTATMSNTDAGLPDIGTTSMSQLLYSSMANAGAIRARGGLGTTLIGDAVTGGGAASLRIAGVGSTDGAVDSTGVVRPTWMTINRTASSETLVNDLEKVTFVFNGAPTGKQIKLGSSTNVPGACNYLYCVEFFGAAAEMTTTQQKRVLQVLGWSIPWS